ncbi:unnamed protein product [Plutella xylostella]|uniref:(diamondback moth) hypothetical protein n=1 Tax=Plutella xylostella TaxID=51655 RepID=A0A8S4D969_PLUXY|nr:unnamed protein product [Plutella xylostella]
MQAASIKTVRSARRRTRFDSQPSSNFRRSPVRACLPPATVDGSGISLNFRNSVVEICARAALGSASRLDN